MENKKLYRELSDNKRGNKIFHDQKSKDIEELKTIVESNGELVVDFPVEEWDKVAPSLMRNKEMTQLEATRSYIASKIFDNLKEKYSQLEVYDLNNSKEKPNLNYNLNYIRDILEIEDLAPKRIHFIMNGTKSAILCDALSILLSNDYSFDTYIYTSPNVFYTTVIPDSKEKVYLWQEYNYTYFYGDKDGEQNIASRNKVKTK